MQGPRLVGGRQLDDAAEIEVQRGGDQFFDGGVGCVGSNGGNGVGQCGYG